MTIYSMTKAGEKAGKEGQSLCGSDSIFEGVKREGNRQADRQPRGTEEALERFEDGAAKGRQLGAQQSGGWPAFAVLAKERTHAACVEILILFASAKETRICKKSCDRQPHRSHFYKKCKGGPASHQSK